MCRRSELCDLHPPPAGCAHLRITWQKSHGAMGKEELEWRVYYTPATTSSKKDEEYFLAGATSEDKFELIGLASGTAYLITTEVRHVERTKRRAARVNTASRPGGSTCRRRACRPSWPHRAIAYMRQILNSTYTRLSCGRLAGGGGSLRRHHLLLLVKMRTAMAW